MQDYFESLGTWNSIQTEIMLVFFAHEVNYQKMSAEFLRMFDECPGPYSTKTDHTIPTIQRQNTKI